MTKNPATQISHSKLQTGNELGYIGTIVNNNYLKVPTISPDLGRRPCHLGIACARSTYAALVPVPKITAAITSWL